jgi:hypothetical protein
LNGKVVDLILEHKWDLSVAYTYRDVSIWISAFGVSISEMQIDLLESQCCPLLVAVTLLGKEALTKSLSMFVELLADDTSEYRLGRHLLDISN